MPRVNPVAKLSPIKDQPDRKIIIAVIIIGAVLLALLAVTFIFPLAFEKPYFVVYTTNGEIFVGKASWFPRFNLTNAYIVQTGVPAPEAAPGSNLQLVPLRDTPWSPKKLYFERGQIIFYGPIDEKSNVAATLQNR